MRKNLNSVTIQGYVYNVSKLSKKVTGETSKKPGTEFITGELEVVVDEEGLNVIPVHFTYVTEFYTKSGKANNTFTILNKLIDEPEKTWVSGGKDAALKVKIDGSIALNDFIDAQDQRVSAKRNEGSFVTLLSVLPKEEERNIFSADIVINKITHVDANPEKNIVDDYVSISGALFNFRNDLLPIDSFVVKNKAGMEYFENLDISPSEPIYTKIWGRVNNQTIKTEKSEEAAFGENIVTTQETKSREYVITGTAKVPYDFGDDNVMTAEELKTAIQNREVAWAEIKKRNDEYKASKAAATTTAMPTAKDTLDFKF